MGASTKTTYVWRGIKGNPGKTVIMEVTNEAAALVLQTGLLALSDAAIVSQSYSSLDNYDATPLAGSLCERRAVCYFQDVDNNRLLRVTVPSPKAAMVEMTDNGERVKSTTLVTIQELLETATGRDLRPLYGVVVQKS